MCLDLGLQMLGDMIRSPPTAVEEWVVVITLCVCVCVFVSTSLRSVVYSL